MDYKFTAKVLLAAFNEIMLFLALRGFSDIDPKMVAIANLIEKSGLQCVPEDQIRELKLQRQPK